MNPSVRTPFHQMPVTHVIKAMEQKYFRQLHCTECGWPLADITDKSVLIMEGNTLLERLRPDQHGLIEIHCKRHQCKQYTRLEFAV